MGYLQAFEQELKARLANLEEREQKDVIRFVKEKILESYKNGIMSVKLTAADKEATKQSRRFARGKTERQ